MSTIASPLERAAPADLPARRVVLFVLLSCLFSWSLWLPAIASTRGWIPVRFASGPWGSFGPALAGLVMAWRYGEPVGVGAMLRSLVSYRGPSRRLTAAALLPLAFTGFALGAHVLLTGPLPAFDVGKLVWLPAIVLLIGILGGPLGEEPGWRGYLTPVLLGRLSPIATSAVVAGMWLLWHLPLFWMEGAAQEGSSIALFAGMVAAYAVIFTWLYRATAPSLVPVLLLHTSVNVLGFGLPYVLPGVDESQPYNLGYVLAAGVAALAIAASRDFRRAPES